MNFLDKKEEEDIKTILHVHTYMMSVHFRVFFRSAFPLPAGLDCQLPSPPPFVRHFIILFCWWCVRSHVQHSIRRDGRRRRIRRSVIAFNFGSMSMRLNANLHCYAEEHWRGRGNGMFRMDNMWNLIWNFGRLQWMIKKSWLWCDLISVLCFNGNECRVSGIFTILRGIRSPFTFQPILSQSSFVGDSSISHQDQGNF